MALSAMHLTAAEATWPFPRAFLPAVRRAMAALPSTSVLLSRELPALVMPPWDSLSPLELFLGTVPSQHDTLRPDSKRVKSPNSAATRKALGTLMPFKAPRAST